MRHILPISNDYLNPRVEFKPWCFRWGLENFTVSTFKLFEYNSYFWYM